MLINSFSSVNLFYSPIVLYFILTIFIYNYAGKQMGVQDLHGGGKGGSCYKVRTFVLLVLFIRVGTS